MSLTLIKNPDSIDGMSNVIDIQRYKLAKVLIKDLTKVIEDYEHILKAVDIIQKNLNKWSKYRSPVMTNYKLDEFKFFLQQETIRIKTSVKFEKKLIGHDTT